MLKEEVPYPSKAIANQRAQQQAPVLLHDETVSQCDDHETAANIVQDSTPNITVLR